MLRKYIILTVGALIFISCKKEKTTWNTDWSAPLVHGHLTIDDMIPVENSETNPDNYLSLVYHGSVYSFSLDTLLNVPDTVIVNKYAIGLPSFTFNPGATIPSTQNQTYDMGDIELKRVIVSSGTGVISVKNTWPGQTFIGFNFPQVFENGSTFTRQYILPAGSMADPTEDMESVDMKDFDMDLTGSDGNYVNTLYADFNMGSAETVNDMTVSNQDTLYYAIEFIDVVPKYAKGYFGQHQLSDTIGIDFPLMKHITSGMIDIDSIDMTVTVKNGFKLIAQTKITKLTGINTRTGGSAELDFPLKNTSMNINPAIGGYWDWQASEYPISVNNGNSTILSFIENLSDSISLGFELDVNPYGNVSDGSDEFFPGSTMDLYLDAEFPMKFAADDLTIVDTFDINYDSPETTVPTSGVMVLNYQNAFPIGADAQFFLLDENGAVIDSISGNTSIIAGQYNSSTYLTSAYQGAINFNLTRDNITNLDLTDKMVLEVAFTTDQAQKVRIDASAYFDFNLRSNLQIKFNF